MTTMQRGHSRLAKWGMSPLVIILAACGAEAPPPVDTPSYNIDEARITASGASSGAMIATQLHVAHSGLVSGVAMISGGPYYCAEGSLKKGLGPCMKGGDVGLAALLDYSQQASDAGAIDDVANLDGDPVWIFFGTNDAVMHRDLTNAASGFYKELTGNAPIVVDTVPAVHGFPTATTGAPCEEMVSPFLNACDYDAAGELLATLHGELQPASVASSALIEIPQPGANDATMMSSALAYVPKACEDGAACGVHVAFHGCQQSTAFVGDAFAAGAGYNEWAETNKLIVLYPQVDSSKIAPMNPMGCWDWWGYTDENYATKAGAQITVVKAMLDSLAGRTL